MTALGLALVLAGTPAYAVHIVSAPLQGGPGGLVCACTNLTPDLIEVNISIGTDTGGVSCAQDFHFVGSCSSSSSGVRRCRVTRQDGKKLTTKDVACSFMSVDAAGAPIVVVPVDRRKK